jgi:hypothetical protein
MHVLYLCGMVSEAVRQRRQEELDSGGPELHVLDCMFSMLSFSIPNSILNLP